MMSQIPLDLNKVKKENIDKEILRTGIIAELDAVNLYEQMAAMKKMGPLSKVMELIPGMGQLKMPKDMLQVQEGKLEKWRHIMGSCTKEELENLLWSWFNYVNCLNRWFFLTFPWHIGKKFPLVKLEGADERANV